MESVGITVYGCERDEEEAFRALSPRFGVAPAVIAEQVSESSAGLAAGNRCVSVSHKSKVSAPVIFALKNAGVKYISARSVGLDHIDTQAAREAGITVGGSSYPPDGVADYTVMLMLMAARGVKAVISSAEKFDFRQSCPRGKELRDMTVGVIGAGNIGGAVIERLRGFGCRVLTYDRGGNAPTERVSLEELLRSGDIITLHLPLNAETRHILGREQIGAMRRGAFIVNTGRGALVDTAALVEALEDGRIGGAALDVVEGEEGIFYSDCREKPMDNPLLRRLLSMPNVVITPHTAYYTQRALLGAVENTMAGCLDFERSFLNG